MPDPDAPRADDPVLHVQREALKAALQRPALAGPVWDTLDAGLFTHPRYRACRDAIAAAGGIGGATSGGAAFVAQVREAAPDDAVRSLITELAVEPLRTTDDGEELYVASVVARLQELGITPRLVELKGRLQRLNPVEQADDYNKLFADLIALEARKRALREQAVGAL
ncbi:MAG: DNA primase, partial [Frankia sp.]|nr:DNA primase [Frankia sp.]